MRKLLLMALLLPLWLFGDLFPPSGETTIQAVGTKKITLETAMAREGMSGVVVHDYGNDLHAISAYLIQGKENEATVVRRQAVDHPNLPSIKTDIQTGDKVIGGYLYDNVLVIAPDAKSYNEIVQRYTKHWFHPDLLAVYMAKASEASLSKTLLRDFCAKNHIGLVVVIKNGTAVALDPISGKHVGEEAVSTATQKAQYPFYHRIEGLDFGGWFSSSKKGDYFQEVKEL